MNGKCKRIYINHVELFNNYIQINKIERILKNNRTQFQKYQRTKLVKKNAPRSHL